MNGRVPQLAGRLNLIPIAAMSLLWISPVLQFWLAVAGPLLPFEVIPPPRPSLFGFLFGFTVSFLPLLLPTTYYQPRPFELRGTLYEALGVRVFRHLATNGDFINRLVRRRHPWYRIICSAPSLDEYYAGTCYGEKWHLVFLVMGTLTIAYAASIGWLLTALFLSITNIIFNLYPVFLQRYTRARIVRLLAQYQHRGA